MPKLPVTRARTANLPLMLQPDGITRSSGNKAARICWSRSAWHDPPSNAPSFLPTRNSCGATKQPFHSPWRSSRARASSGLKRPVAEDSRFRAKPWRTSNWLRLVVSPSTLQTPRCRFLCGVDAQIIAVHRASADQFCQLIARFDAAGPAIGVFVDAELIECRRIDPVEPVGHVAQLERAAVADGR